MHSSYSSVDLITFTITSASLENKLLLEPKPTCLCCSWLDPEYIQSVTALFPQGSVPFESNFSHVVLFKSSHSKFQPTYANLLRWNITHDSSIMINTQTSEILFKPFSRRNTPHICYKWQKQNFLFHCVGANKQHTVKIHTHGK